MVWWTQVSLMASTLTMLAAVAHDVNLGLQETVGVFAKFVEGEQASVVISLPEEADPRIIAYAIDLEHVEAWCDEEGMVHVAIGPWYTTKDVDQVVLSVTKVLHVLLGLHKI